MKSINENIEIIASRYGENIAISDLKGNITYRELVKKINTLSSILNISGINRQDRVAILLENSIEYIISIYSILRCSCIFVPLPFEAPVERQKRIIDDCNPSILITNTKCYIKLKDVFGENNFYDNMKYILIDCDNEKDYFNDKHIIFWNSFICKEISFKENYNSADIAYIVYTSGSTGSPKGVAIQADSLMNMICNTIDQFRFDNWTNYLSMLPFNFDGAFGGIFTPIAVGGRLVIYRKSLIRPKDLVNKLLNDRISFFGCTPALFVMLIDYITQEMAEQLLIKTISIGGDFIPKEYVARFYDLFSGVELFNRYGPTETTSIVSTYKITQNDLQRKEHFPIGHPDENVIFYAYNQEGNLIREGEVGELMIGGCQLMRFYWNDEMLTNKVIKYIEGERFYCSGDFVTIDSENNYILLGRNSNMIKRYGYRVFLSEIENALLSNDKIKECICITHSEENKTLAFIVSNECNISIIALKNELSNQLPYYMMPDDIIQIDQIPYNSIGKIDKEQLISLFK